MKTYLLLLALIVSMAGSAFATANFQLGLREELLTASGSDQKFSIIAKLWSPRDIRELDQALHARRAPLAERHLEVYTALRANAAETQDPVIAWLESAKASGEVEGFTAHWIDNMIVVYGTADVVLALSEHPAVELVMSNFSVELIEPVLLRGPIRGTRPANTLDTPELTTPGQDAIGATRVNRELGINGLGTLVANCDTGVDRLHPALQSRWRGTHAPTSECWLDLLGGSPLPTDGNSHGTHVMGTICGREFQTDGDTITVGSAPMAEWIATNPINQGVGGGFDQDILDAYEWFADPDGNPNTMEDVPDVIQNSWGVFTGLGYPQCASLWNTVILNCEAAGPVITWSAGNESTSGLRSPAIFELNPTQIFSVAAVDANPNTPPFPIADFSSRGPTPCQPNPGAIKPEIAAPGVDVYSCIPGNQYTDGFSGTSMAGPHVAGVVALMREACPNCDPQTIKEAIMTTAIDVGYPPTGPDNAFGAGFINAYDAVMMVASLGRIDGFVTTTGGAPLQGVRIQALGEPAYAMSNASGYFNLSAAEGTYTVRFTKFGYQTAEFPGIQTFEGDTTHLDAEMALVASGAVRVTVRTQIGQIMQNVRIKFQETPIDTMLTNAQGQIFIPVLPATTYGVNMMFTINIPGEPLVLNQDTSLTLIANDTLEANLILNNYLIEPAGPDAYGYRAYDRYDRDFPAPAEWVEISSDSGGSGTRFSFVNGDSAVFFNTPFPIKFYGQAENQLTVNCNGWLLPGVHTDAGRFNIPIPGSQQDPPGIIAVFWDDLRTSAAAKQFSYYDAGTGRYIFEFIQQRLTNPANHLHTYQVHFLDPAVHPTRTGDCQIVFVYQAMPWITQCTIGIESQDETMGIEILHNSDLDSTSWPIEQGAAIRFTTGTTAQTGTINGTLAVYPADPNFTTADIWVGGVLVHPNAQGVFTGNQVPAAPVSGVVLLDGYEVARADGIVVPANGSANMGLHSRHIDPVRNLAYSQNEGRVTMTWDSPASVVLRPDPPVTYEVIENGVSVAQGITDHEYVAIFLAEQTVIYNVVTHYPDGQSSTSTPLTVEVDFAVTGTGAVLPKVFALYTNYPNPFNPSTEIRLDVPVSTEARLEIFDIQGRLVQTLLSGSVSAGVHTFTWNGKNSVGASAATGVYLYRFTAPQYTSTQKMLLVK